MSLEYLNNPQLNQAIVEALTNAIVQCHKIYEGQSKSFAVILHDLEKLLIQCQHKLGFGDHNESIHQVERQEEKFKQNIIDEEKLVYVRLFHKQMPTLAEEKASLVWIKSLLESIKMTEKHGLAVYDSEENVKRSLKNENYAYATLRIASKQDVTDQHAIKLDTELNCPLLTIKEVTLDNLLKLTYADKDYMIKNGVIRRPHG